MRLLSFLVAFGAAVSALPTAGLNILQKREARTSPPSGCLSVGSGRQYTTLQAALSALGSGTGSACIFVYNGNYQVSETVQVAYKGPLTIYGYTDNIASYKSNVVNFIRNINSATSGNLESSAAVRITGTNVKVYNINFKNVWSSGGQAVAIAVLGDRNSFYACGFYGRQDTLYAKSGKQYYSNCYVEGTVDYIFGAAAAWFGECTIASIGDGYITANSRTEPTDTTWYVFDNSVITRGFGYSGKVYLGRPWRVLARVIYQNSELTDVVRQEGYHTMAEGATPEFREFANTGAGSDTSKRLYFTQGTTAQVTKNQLWGSDWKSWIDTTW